MSIKRRRFFSLHWVILLIALLISRGVAAAELNIAVASNFAPTLKALVKLFTQQSIHTVAVISGSSGKHYAQIVNGAPFDIFLSADIMRAQLLEKAGFAVPATRRTYALGKLVLWSADPTMIVDGGAVLHDAQFRYLVIANPGLAPYGAAAIEVLQALDVLESSQFELVRGENIAQALQFIHSENAELGFVALAQIKRLELLKQTQLGSMWLVPQALYQPIEQQLILVKDSPAAREFLAFLNSREALHLIQEYGYDIPIIKSQNIHPSVP